MSDKKKGVFKNKSYELVIFGGTGDLACHKLIPALYNLHQQGKLPQQLTISAIGRRYNSEREYFHQIRQSVEEFSRLGLEINSWEEFKKKINYLQFDIKKDQGYKNLKMKLNSNAYHIFYLAVAPDFFDLIVEKIKKHGLNNNQTQVARLVIEKPFGHNLKSARRLNEKIINVFPEKDIFRIDHYLGKEMLQNIMVIRFGNSIFEPLWNNKYIDNIQIISTESNGVGDRAGYYDQAGALKDMVQNHMMQLLTLTAMEPPVNMETKSIRDEKVKILKVLQLDTGDIKNNVIRGQYGPGEVDGEVVVGYREEEGTSDKSNTESFVAIKLCINNLRWQGVPFYIKTGKRLTHKSTEVIVEFKSGVHPFYNNKKSRINPNILVIRIQPLEGVFFQFNSKEPGTEQEVVPVKMNYCQNCKLESNSPAAYERLLYDIMKGDSTLFTRWDEVEHAWEFIDNINRNWINTLPDFPNYCAGSRGPEAAEHMLKRDGRNWWQINELNDEEITINNRGDD